MSLIVSTMFGGCGAGGSESGHASFKAPETEWVGTWTKLAGEKAESQTIVVTEKDRTLFDGTGIELRDRDYNFAFWNGPRDLVAYSSDVGTKLVRFNSDGSEHEVFWATDVGCIEIDQRVKLDERQLKAIQKLLCP